MVSQEYSEAIAETLDILEHTDKNDVNKISKKQSLMNTRTKTQ